ncbi:argonaute 3 [Megalopta genalis]|uniref:argonaute 3 n=1 Tax=Megalopta genalis TaxID=115081 RepID=UPI003FD13F1F
MDNNKEKLIGNGRGNLLLKLIRERNRAGNEAAAAAVASASDIPTVFPIQSLPSSTRTYIPEPIISAPKLTMSQGRASLLDMIKARKAAATNHPLQVTPLPQATPLPETTLPSQIISSPEEIRPCIGRGSILNQIKIASSVPQTPIRPHIPGSSDDNTAVFDKLSDITLEDTVSSSEVSSFQSPRLVPQQGTSGKSIQLSANYINLKLDAEKGLFNYEVKFSPDIDSRPLRRKLLNQHIETLGRTRVFDGVTLCLPKKLKQDITILTSTHPMDQSTITMSLIFKKQQNMGDNIAFFNLLLGRVMRALSLVRIGQHNFNPKGIRAIPQHKLEVWPGYVTSISEYQGGLKLCLDAKHRVMRTETVRDIMMSFGQKPNFRDLVTKEIIGLSVFTRYNNRTYRVDDIAWDKNPTYVFEKGEDKISLLDYYKQHWNLQIQDAKQPLLVNCAKIKTTTGQTQEQIVLLVPELCYIASLTDSIRSDFRIMKDLDEVTKMSPNARRDVLKHFVQEVQSNDIPRDILAEWGLSLENELVNFKGRLLEPEEIIFGRDKRFKSLPHKSVDWGNVVSRNPMLRTTDLNQWCILHCQKDTRSTREFIEMFKKVSKAMGVTTREPQIICLRDDRTESYVQELRRNIQRNINLMVVVFPTNRTDRYSAVKRICCVEMPVPSQVIISRTISRADKLKSITEKIALQINCKLGGALWTLAIPMENCMICGIDVYHGGIGQSTKGSVAGFVASLDKLLTTWHSKICLQGRHQELMDMLQVCMTSALKAYYKHNKRYPDRIIVYRDGVGDGQIDTVGKYEVKQLLVAFKNIEPNYQPTLTVIAVHKRINTRLFATCPRGLENPLPGSVVDTCITRSEVYDFFLVSQNVRMGTVSPTRYIVVYDNKNMKAEHIQRLTYKLCHLYYNWPGTVKVPAPCQYAHKLVSLVGQNIQMEPHQCLSDTLFYL